MVCYFHYSVHNWFLNFYNSLWYFLLIPNTVHLEIRCLLPERWCKEMAIIIELSSSFGECLSTVVLPSVLFPNRGTAPVIVIKQRPLFRAWKHAAKNWRSPQKMPVTTPAPHRRHSVALLSLCGCRAGDPVSKPAGRPALFLLLSISGPCHRRCRAKLLSLGNQAKCFQLLDLLISPSHRSPTSASVRIRKHLIASAWCTVMRA